MYQIDSYFSTSNKRTSTQQIINFTKYVIFVRRLLTQLSGEHCGINQLSFWVHLLYDYDFDIFIQSNFSTICGKFDYIRYNSVRK